MKILSAIATRLSGSIGGLTGSHNRGGMYLRGRSMPTNPNTPAQQGVREIFSSLTIQWSALTQDQRDAWALYAANVPVQNKMGGQSNITGANMFVRCNAPRLQAGLAVILTGPLEFNLGAAPIFSGLDLNDAPSATVNVTRADTGPAGNVLLYTSRMFAPTINYFRGPYQFAGATSFAAAAANPIAVAEAPSFTWVAGQRAFIRAVISYADGRLSPEAQDTAIIGTSA